jgi:hypothetical protein
MSATHGTRIGKSGATRTLNAVPPGSRLSILLPHTVSMHPGPRSDFTTYQPGHVPVVSVIFASREAASTAGMPCQGTCRQLPDRGGRSFERTQPRKVNILRQDVWAPRSISRPANVTWYRGVTNSTEPPGNTRTMPQMVHSDADESVLMSTSVPVRHTSVVSVMTYAPISFPLYGLDAKWHGPRWLHHFNASSDGVASVSLAHGHQQRPSPTEPWFSVTSAGRDSRDDGWIALDVLHDLTRMVMPELREREMVRYEHAAGRFVVDNVNDRSMWTRTTWSVNGHSVAASTFDLAGAWAGYAAVAGGSVQVLGSRQEEDRAVRLVSLGDTSAYHFAVEDPLEFPRTQQASAAAVWDSADRLWSNWPPHRDHNTFLANHAVEGS